MSDSTAATATAAKAGTAATAGTANVDPAWAIVLAGGGGTRFGGPKQFYDLGGEPLVAHPVHAAAAACAGIVVVLPAALIDRWSPPPNIGSPVGVADPVTAVDVRVVDVRVVAGGATRAESVRAGLAAVPADAGIIVITDAAHPLATPALYRRVVDEVRAGADAAVPGLPLTEVVKEIRPMILDGFTDGAPRLVTGASLPRETHRLVQTPHAFRASLLRAAHDGAPEAVEDSAMVAAAGGQVVVVPGEPANIHVTTPDELAMARLLLTHVRSEGESDEFGTGRVRAVR